MFGKKKQQEREETIRLIKSEIMKGGKMAKDVWDEDEDIDDLDEEEEVLEEKPKSLIKSKPKPQMPAKTEEVKADRYVAVHQAQVDGIFDSETNKMFSVDIMEILASIKNDLSAVKKAVGA